MCAYGKRVCELEREGKRGRERERGKERGERERDRESGYLVVPFERFFE